MITKETLEKNYREMYDDQLIILAEKPHSLHPFAVEILEKELKRRNIETQIREIIEPEEELPEVSQQIKTQYPDAVEIFSFEQAAIFKSTAALIIFGVFCIYISQGRAGNIVSLTWIGVLFISLALYIIIKIRKLKPLLVIFEDRVVFKRKVFRNGSRLGTYDLLSFVFSSKMTTIRKSDIKKIVMPTNYTRLQNFYFLTKNGDNVEIFILASKEYLTQIRTYLEGYLENGKDN